MLAQPWIHRDVKPSNVMLCNGRVKLIDLGIARTYHAGATHDTVRYGTPGYAPPEQFGYGQTSVRSDVYALGMTLAFCLTGQEPTADLRESGFANPRIPAALAKVLVRATEFDPANRYASARDLRSAIEAALQTQHGSTPAPGPIPEPATTPEPATPPAPSTVPIPGTAPGTTTSSRERATNTQTHDSNRTKKRVGDILNTIGRVWNAIVVIMWVLMTISVIVNIVQPRGKYLEYPGWFNALMFLGLLYVPWTLLSYLLLDKRRLRQREPFSRWTWRKELPVCLGVSAACMAVVVILYYALFNQGR
jgi:serine/threonine protein kinase